MTTTDVTISDGLSQMVDAFVRALPGKSAITIWSAYNNMFARAFRELGIEHMTSLAAVIEQRVTAAGRADAKWWSELFAEDIAELTAPERTPGLEANALWGRADKP
jgi:hypothetical protein